MLLSDKAEDAQRTEKEYFYSVFQKFESMFEGIKNSNSFSPPLFDNDNQIYHLALLNTVMLTSKTARIKLQKELDWNAIADL